MTTVGYGDVYPMEVGGYLATAIVMVIGLMVTALPVAIIGGNFTVVYEYNHKRNNQKESDSRYMEKVCTYLNQSKGNKDHRLSVSSVRPFDDWVISSVNWFYKTLWDIQRTFAAIIIRTGVTLSQAGGGQLMLLIITPNQQLCLQVNDNYRDITVTPQAAWIAKMKSTCNNGLPMGWLQVGTWTITSAIDEMQLYVSKNMNESCSLPNRGIEAVISTNLNFRKKSKNAIMLLHIWETRCVYTRRHTRADNKGVEH